MADTVQLHMEEMLPELQDFEEQKVFTPVEIKKITKTRRSFEYEITSLTANVSHFRAYIQHELAVESLRRKRQQKINSKRRTLSSFSIIRRVHHLYTRALTKFSSDKQLWLEYVNFCADSGSVNALNKVLMRALRYHPREGVFWAAASERQAKLGNIDSARSLALRGLRTTAQNSVCLWRAMLNIEMIVTAKVPENIQTVLLIFSRAWQSIDDSTKEEFGTSLLTQDGVADELKLQVQEAMRELKGAEYVEALLHKNEEPAFVVDTF